jgi:hypothetical protein
VWPDNRGGLIRGVAFGECGLIIGVAFGECGLIRGVQVVSLEDSLLELLSQ